MKRLRRIKFGRMMGVLAALLLAAQPAHAALVIQVQVLRDGAGLDGLDGAKWIAISPDGQHVYAAGFLDSAIAVFARNAATGRLSFVEAYRDGADGVDGLQGIFSIVVSPDGRHVYASGSSEDAVVVFSRNATTGALAPSQVIRDGASGVDGLDDPNAMAVSPDGRHLYVASFNDHALAVFSRDDATGWLSFAGLEKDGLNGVDGLYGAYAVRVSADDQFVYGAGLLDNSVAVFRRDADSGRLAFVEVEKDGVNGVDGLGGAYGVTLSPDGQHLYVPSLADNAVAVFSRNTRTGRLSFVEALRDGAGGVDGLSMSFDAAITPDGERVYVASYEDNAVTILNRNGSTGRLTLAEIERDGAFGIDGLSQADAVTLSPDGRHLYAAGFGDDAIAVFSVPAATLYLPNMNRNWR